MLSQLVAFGRLNVVLMILLGTVLALISAQPVPMDEDDIGAMAYRLFHDAVDGLDSSYAQHNPAPASALHANQAANPDLYHPANHLADSHSSSGTQGMGWTGHGFSQHSMQEWMNPLHPAEPATTIQPPDTPAHVQVRLDHQDPYASGLVGQHAAYGGNQARPASSSRATKRKKASRSAKMVGAPQNSGSLSGSQLATLPEPARALAMNPREVLNPTASHGANPASGTSQARSSAVPLAVYLVSPSHGNVPKISEYGFEVGESRAEPGQEHLRRYRAAHIFHPVERIKRKDVSAVMKATPVERNFVQEKLARDMALANPKFADFFQVPKTDVLMEWYPSQSGDFTSDGFNRIRQAARTLAGGGYKAKAQGPFTPYFVNDHLIQFTRDAKHVQESPVYGQIAAFRVTAVPYPNTNEERTHHLGYVHVNRMPIHYDGVAPLPPWNLA